MLVGILCTLLASLAGCDDEPSLDSPAVTNSRPASSDHDINGTIGIPVGLEGSSGQSVFSLTIETIHTESSCPSRLDPGATIEPENGFFIVVELSATMSEDFGDLNFAEPFMTLDSDAFAIANPAGQMEATTHTVAAHGCHTLDELVQPFINPGEDISGLIVLDTELDHGYLIYNPWGVPNHGWRWEF